MQYLALIYSAPDVGGALEPWFEYEAWLKSENAKVVSSNALEPAESATTLRLKNGKAVPHDGPFAETKEVLGGYYLFECDNLDEALRLAEKIPTVAEGGSVEVRPIMVIPDMAG